jgi:prepilin-type N-terminal cleavage/methylation domain-containing protein
VSVARALRLQAAREGGFGLLELLITMTMVSVLLGISSMFFTTTLHHSGEVSEENALQTEVRGAIDRIIQDIRGASYGDNVTSPIEAAESSSITFVTPDRLSPVHLRRISYRLNSGRLERATALSTNVSGPPWTIPSLGSWSSALPSIVNLLLFTYLDASGVTTTDPAAVRTVIVTISVAPKTSNGRQFTYSTSVTMRTTL